MKYLKLIMITIILLCLALISAEPYEANSLRRGTRNEFNSPEITRNSVDQRNLIPPSDLTATLLDLVNVQLSWSAPTDLIHIFYHDGNFADGYYQSSDRAYGTVFDLTDYPEAILEYLDFRHSPWGLNGTWEYSIIIIDWIEGTLLQRIDDLTTTVNNGWELEVPLGSLDGVTQTGIFIIPLGNSALDAFPVVDLDAELNGSSYVIHADDYSVDVQATGDFLMDLWIREGTSPARSISSSGIKTAAVHPPAPLRERQELLGYKIYRDENEILEITDPAILSYIDEDLPDGTFTYYVTALYDQGESEPSNAVSVEINTGLQVLWRDNFQAYPDFATDFPPWTVLDLDGGPTYGFTNVTFPGEYQPMGFVIINPSATSPPLTGLTPVSGSKMAASFASSNQQSNNWLISHLFNLGTESSLSFQARSYSSQYGLDRFRVGISTTDTDPDSFTIISADDYVSAPVAWTEFTYDLSDYDEQSVYFAINCVSDDSWVLLLDDFKILSIGGSDTDDVLLDIPDSAASRNYPNPFNPETTIEFSLPREGETRVEIFNLRGQRIALLLAEYLPAGSHRVNWSGRDSRENEVTSGVYLYRIVSEESTQTGKMILLK
jgi:hypothetical protein